MAHTFKLSRLLLRMAWAGLVAGLAGTVTLHSASAAEPALHLRIVGGLAGLPQYTQFEQPFWTQELPRLTQGQLQADIVPFNQAGIRNHEALRLITLGVVPFGTVLLSGVLTTDPELAALDLAGLNTDMASLKRSLAAFRPHLEKTLRERHGMETLAVYTYPPQVLFCSRPLKDLADLAGRRVRVSSPTQADLLRPFGATAVQVEFADVVASMRNGHVDCAITGGLSGNKMGLHEVSSHMHTAATTWGVSVFGANLAAWNALPEAARTRIKAAMPSLEAAIWTDAEAQTQAGVACNTGQPSCQGGARGRMTAVTTNEADRAKLREAFRTSVLPTWVQRCGNDCATLWNRLMAAGSGVQAQPLPNRPAQ